MRHPGYRKQVFPITTKWSHQLSAAPADTVAGDAAEVALPGNLDLGTRRTLPLMLWRLWLQEAAREVLLRSGLHVHTGGTRERKGSSTNRSQEKGYSNTMRSYPSKCPASGSGTRPPRSRALEMLTMSKDSVSHNFCRSCLISSWTVGGSTFSISRSLMKNSAW